MPSHWSREMESPAWRKANLCQSEECAEVAQPDDAIFMRNSGEALDLHPASAAGIETNGSYEWHLGSRARLPGAAGHRIRREHVTFGRSLVEGIDTYGASVDTPFLVRWPLK